MKAFPIDIEVPTLKIRHVGIENELAIGRDYTNDLPREAQKTIKKRGLLQSVGHDGGGREFRTNPISLRSLYQVRGHKYLTEYFAVLKHHGKVLESGGTHIHISILRNDHPNMEANATALGVAFFPLFQKMCGRNSRWAYNFADSRYPMRSVADVKRRLSELHCGGRTYSRVSSMLNPTRHQTLELRGGRGSKSVGEVLAWIEFLKNIVEVSNQESIEGVKFKELLKGERIKKYLRKLPKERKFTKAELNKTVNTKRLI